MGDKGGKKNKEKGQKQKATKQTKIQKRRRTNNPKRTDVGETESDPKTDILGQASAGIWTDHCLDFPGKEEKGTFLQDVLDIDTDGEERSSMPRSGCVDATGVLQHVVGGGIEKGRAGCGT